MRKFVKIIILTICFLMISTIAFASGSNDTKLIMSYNPVIANEAISNEIKVQLNGEYIDFTDSEGNRVDPQLINSRTMVPMRKIFEVFGANVEWFEEDRTIKATTENFEIGLQIDNEIATIKNESGEETEIKLDSAPTIVNGRTLVPVRFIAESLEKKVGWDAENKTVIIIDTSFVSERIKEAAPNLYEYLTLEKVLITSSESTATLTGKIKYEDKEDTSNNTSLTITGDVETKMKEKLLQVDFELYITGKGILMDTIKEEGLKNIEGSLLFDLENYETYMKFGRNIVGEELEDKWIKYTSSEVDKENIENMLNLSKSETTIDVLAESLLGEELTVASYDSLEMTIDMICALASDEKLSLSGRSTKRFEYELDLEDILDLIGATEEEKELYNDQYDITISSSEKYSEGVLNNSVTTIIFGIETEIEELDIELKIDSSLENYNKKVKITMPEDDEIVEL